MRKFTAAVTSLMAASALTVAWSAGQATMKNNQLLPAVDSANPLPSANPNPTTSATQDPSAPATQDPQASQSGGTPSATATAPATTPAPSSTAPPATTASPAPAAPAAPVVITLNSDAITYKYGVVQISLTKTDGAITDIQMVQGDTTNGRAAAYVSLIDATLQVQSTNYGNVSGATFTTDAFKKAVDNVLAKF